MSRLSLRTPGQRRPECVAGHVRFELRNVGANYPFERSHGFAGIPPNSGFGDYSRAAASGIRSSGVGQDLSRDGGFGRMKNPNAASGMPTA
jgi:hypothetical protein